MVEHICEKCGGVFNKKSTYNYHINRKYPCFVASPLNIKVQQLEQQLKDLILVVQELQKKDAVQPEQ